MKIPVIHSRSISAVQPQRCHCLVFFLLGLHGLLFISSCGSREDAKTGNQTPGFELNLQEIKRRYQDAPYYFDQAKLVLQYTINGTPYEEVHPCSSHLVRNQSQRVHRFKLEVIGKSEVTIARVLDAQSQNLDGQVLCLARNPSEFWNLVKTDSIAQHFAFGVDDIPWNENLDSDDKTRFLGIASNLFNGLNPGWFAEENLVETKRVEVSGIQFADTVFKTAYGKVECRIDFHEKTIVGIRLPMELLSEKISSSPAVSGVSLAILFQGISFDAKGAAEVKIGPHENPISEFVQLPEQFPSKAIGSKVESWNITDSKGQTFDPATAIGAAGIYFYGEPSQLTKAEIRRIETLSKEKRFANFAWFLPPATPFNRALEFSRMGLFLDQKGDMLKNIDAGSTSFYLIVNQSGTIQFVCKQKEDWLKDIGPILERVRQGDNVAQEMHQEYSSYFEKYQSALIKNSVKKSLLDSVKNPQ